jgi:hypothetical protein
VGDENELSFTVAAKPNLDEIIAIQETGLELELDHGPGAGKLKAEFIISCDAKVRNYPCCRLDYQLPGWEASCAC